MGDRRGNPKRIENFANVVNAYTSQYGKNDDQTTVTDEERKTRQAAAAEIADSYYDFASAAYENGWSTHFHYTPFPPSFPPCESTIATALSFYEHRLAFLMNLKPHMKVLDVGCGIGGPAREIAKFVGCEIVGVSINQGQIDRAIYLTRMEGLQDKCTFVRGDFLNLPFAASSFDAAYAIEATVYSPSLLHVYSGISRVLKPGAVFGLSEWVMTPKYNPHDRRHVGIRNRIERGNALTMNTSDQAREAMRGAGFEILHEENFAAHFDYTKSLMEDPAAAGGVGKRAPPGKGRRAQGQETPDLDRHQSPVLVPFKSSPCGSSSDDIVSLRPAPPPSSPFPSSLPVPPSTYRPWFWPFVSATHLATTWTDYWTVWKMSKWPRRCCYWMVWVGERVGLWDKGATDAMMTLAYCVDSTTEAGREGIFSPCWWFIGRKAGDGDAENIQRDGQDRTNVNGDQSGKADENLSVRYPDEPQSKEGAQVCDAGRRMHSQ